MQKHVKRQINIKNMNGSNPTPGKEVERDFHPDTEYFKCPVKEIVG